MSVPNSLINEKSPYLLQHAYNPVQWRPWGDAAFAQSRAEDRPIFLSIGYSTCHWCHVMERESFENDAVAALLNAHFVPIKVDREERPDVDRLYMAATQAMGVGGGWPLNVFLTPELEPFFGGTYFPPDSMRGRPGMLQVLPAVHAAWGSQRAEIVASGARVLAALAGLDDPDAPGADRDGVFERAFPYFERVYDPEQGGFGNAPKFPSVVNLNYLLRYWARDPQARAAALVMVTRQLDAMQAGGIHDLLGGGFHRYATDREWLVPHFEKMLYDQAQLASIYIDGYLITGDSRYADTARDIFAYVSRDLSSPQGGFDSAEDADSEGEEGTFYVWTPQEVESLLGPDTATLFAQRYGVSERGNFEHGTTILSEMSPLARVAAAAGLSEADVEQRLSKACATLFAARSTRVRPHRDDKVLTAWNGLMFSAFSRGARVLGDPDLAARARRAAEFIWTTLWNPNTGAMLRRWREGDAAGAGQLDDYAYFALGCLDLYAADHSPVWLERAIAVTNAQVERFWDDAQGAFFESPADDPSIRLRMKDGFDGAEIAGNSIAAANLERLGVLLDRADWRERSRCTLDYYARRLSDGASAMPQMLVAFDLAHAAPRHIVIVGDKAAADTRAMIAAFDQRFLPNDTLLVAGSDADQRRLAALMPWLASLEQKHGKATAYVCVNYACQLPVTDAAAFAAQLDEGRPLAATRTD